jgi:HlyD family secretion protein
MSPQPSSPAGPAPQRANLAVVPQQPRRSRGPIVAIVLIVALAAAWEFRPRPQARPVLSVRTVKAVRGVLQRTLRVSGNIAATGFSNIFAPLVQAPDSASHGLVLIKLATNGGVVKEGDVLAEIDGQSVKDHLDDVQAMVGQSALDMRRVRAQQLSRHEAMEQQIRAAKAEWEKAQQDIKSSNVRSDIDKEKLRLAVEETELKYRQLATQLPLLDERQAAEWRLAELSQGNQLRHLGRHKTDLDRFTIRAPRDGQVILRSLYRNGEQTQVRLGDEVYPGMVFMKVVNLKNLQVEGSVNQSDAELVHLGQKATIHFDAYPGITVDGTVQSVGTMAGYNRRPNYYVRSVPIRIAVENTDPRVIPDLTANADVVIGEQDNAILIPREAVQETGGKSIVMVKQGDNVAPREVTLGAFSNTQVSVLSGLNEGDEVAIAPDKP